MPSGGTSDHFSGFAGTNGQNRKIALVRSLSRLRKLNRVKAAADLAGLAAAAVDSNAPLLKESTGLCGICDHARQVRNSAAAAQLVRRAPRAELLAVRAEDLGRRWQTSVSALIRAIIRSK